MSSWALSRGASPEQAVLSEEIVVVAVEESWLLMSVGRIGGVVDVEEDSDRRCSVLQSVTAVSSFMFVAQTYCRLIRYEGKQLFYEQLRVNTLPLL